MKNPLRSIISLSILALLLWSCGGMKPGSTSKRNDKHYETFFFGEAGTQYFIKPFSIDGTSGEELLTDITFRYKDQLIDTASFNMSIISSSVIKDIREVRISNGATTAISTDTDLLFNELAKDSYLSRHCVKIPLADTRELFRKADWTVTMETDQGQLVFKAEGKAKKIINELESGLFVLTN